MSQPLRLRPQSIEKRKSNWNVHQNGERAGSRAIVIMQCKTKWKNLYLKKLQKGSFLFIKTKNKQKQNAMQFFIF